MENPVETPRMGPCNERVVWGIVPQGERPIPSCGGHAGFVLENLHRRGSTEYGFGYVGEQDIPLIRCHGPEAGRVVCLEPAKELAREPVKGPVADVPAVDPRERKAPRVGATAGVRRKA